MCVWVYDGSIEGLLSTIYAWFYSSERPERIRDLAHYQEDLLLSKVDIVSDSLSAQKVMDGILKRLGRDSFELMLKAYLSEDEDIAMIIIRFLEYAFKKGPEVIHHLADPRVSAFAKRSAAVSRESHKLIGLLRFVELDSGILYGAYESTYSQLLILAPHFAERLSNQVWVIHDKARGLAAFYRGGQWHIAELGSDFEYTAADSEALIQGLWKRYYAHIAIAERKNENLRRQNMPKKYWKYLIELK